MVAQRLHQLPKKEILLIPCRHYKFGPKTERPQSYTRRTGPSFWGVGPVGPRSFGTVDHLYIYSTSRTEYRISLTEDALKDDTDLRKNVKRVLEVIVGLLKDRVVDSEEPATKKRHVEKIIKKK